MTNLASTSGTTNKTSRDVKMERERIRMEKLREKSRLMNSSAETQRRLLLDDREANSIDILYSRGNF